MPAHRYDGSSFVEHFAHVQNGAFSDTNDKLWAWDGSAWQLIQPVPISGPGGILPVEDLTVDDVGENNVTLSWTLPEQPNEIPNEVWMRIPELTSVWIVQTYPQTTFSHNALDDDTAYSFEVKLVLRTDGEVVAESTVETIAFVTNQAVVGDPAPDPGGGGGGSIIPIVPLPGGGGVGTGGCWWEWELFIWDDDGFGWETTGITGTHAGNDSTFQYDIDTLDHTRMYRFKFCQNCAGVMGPCHYGEPFAGGNWDMTCAGAIQSTSSMADAADDALYWIPKICTNDDDERVMLDGVSGLEVAPGPAFSFFSYDADGEWQIVCDDTITGVVFLAPMPAILDMLEPGHDFSIMQRLRITSAFDAPLEPTQFWWGGLAHTFTCIWGVASFSIRASFLMEDGSTLNFDTDQFSYAEESYIIVLRWDDDGNRELIVNGVVQDTDTSSLQLTSNVIQPVLFGSLVPGLTTAMHYGWGRVITDDEILTFFPSSLTYTPMVLSEGRTGTRVAITRDLWLPPFQGTPQVTISSDSLTGTAGVLDAYGTIITANVDFVPNTQYQYSFPNDQGASSGTNNAPGGGSTDIRANPFGVLNKFLCAGGVGGNSSGGSPQRGGHAGVPGINSGNGGNSPTGATGGTQTAGGIGSTGAGTGGNGSAGQGGSNGGFVNCGSGGGGWYGGGGGGGGHSGAGGSSRVSGIAHLVSASQAPYPNIGDVQLSAALRDPLASTVQRSAGAELCYGFHEPLGNRVYDLFSGGSIASTGSSGGGGLRQGRRAIAGPNDRYWKPSFIAGEVAFAMNPAFSPPASASAHPGWMMEGFFLYSHTGTENGALVHMIDGATARIQWDFPYGASPTNWFMQMNTIGGGLLKNGTMATGILINTWYHLCIRLTPGNVWYAYVNGVQVSTWAHSGSFDCEKLVFGSNAGGVTSRYGFACFAIHPQDDWVPGYIDSVIAAFNEV